MRSALIATTLFGTLLFGAAGCTITHKVEYPDKPIQIALNVKIDQEVRVRLDQDVEALIENNPDLF